MGSSPLMPDNRTDSLACRWRLEMNNSFNGMTSNVSNSMLISSLRRRSGDKRMFLEVIDDSSVEERRDPTLSLANGRIDSNRSLHCQTQRPIDRPRKEPFVLRLLSVPENVSSVDVETAPLTAITQSDGNTDQCSGKELDGHKVRERRKFRLIRTSPRGSLDASWCRTTRHISHR